MIMMIIKKLIILSDIKSRRRMCVCVCVEHNIIDTYV
jgi:hypothetical protein